VTFLRQAVEQPATIAPPVASGDGAGALTLPAGVDLAVVLRAPLFRELTPDQVTRFLALGTPRTAAAG
jgi:hypothetical protein